MNKQHWRTAGPSTSGWRRLLQPPPHRAQTGSTAAPSGAARLLAAPAAACVTPGTACRGPSPLGTCTEAKRQLYYLRVDGSARSRQDCGYRGVGPPAIRLTPLQARYPNPPPPPQLNTRSHLLPFPFHTTVPSSPQVVGVCQSAVGVHCRGVGPLSQEARQAQQPLAARLHQQPRKVDARPGAAGGEGGDKLLILAGAQTQWIPAKWMPASPQPCMMLLRSKLPTLPLKRC